MLKSMLLATSVLFAVPAFAQETPAQDNTQAQQTTPAPVTPATDDKAPGAQDPATRAEANPVQPASQPTQPAQGVAQETGSAMPAQPTQPATASTTPASKPTPAVTQEQVAQAVGRDFGSYDKDADGKLSQAEFTDWMSTLRKSAEPSFQPGTAEATSWASQAFASADTDKSASVNRQELTVFLTPKQPG